MNDFKTSDFFTQIKQGDNVQELRKNCTYKQYKNVMKSGTMPGIITFITRNMIQGANFEVLSPDVIGNGGLSVL